MCPIMFRLVLKWLKTFKNKIRIALEFMVDMFRVARGPIPKESRTSNLLSTKNYLNISQSKIILY